MKPAEPSAQLIAWTQFTPPPDVPWTTDSAGGQALAEFAGRACYQSWDKPNPATSTNAAYLRHILEVGHLSVLEHGTATFYFTGVSRSFTHELIRHRHFSYSQLSQRYVADDGTVVVPEVIGSDPYLMGVFQAAAEKAEGAYAELVHALQRKIAAEARGLHQPIYFTESSQPPACVHCFQPWPCTQATQAATAARKAARQAARSVLPNATETRIVVTGNYRAWRHFIDLRATAGADVEIRNVAMLVLSALQHHASSVFGDYHIQHLDDGTYAAWSPYAERS